MTVTNTVLDPGLPVGALTYTLVTAPTNALISATGVITWTPTEAQGPCTSPFVTVVTQNGGAHLSATNHFTVTVTEVNVAPMLPVQADREVAVLTLLTVVNTATDADLPANTLTYALLTAPAGASISGNGVISWTPALMQGGSTNTFTTRVTDNGSPALSATNSFQVRVSTVNHRPSLAPIPDFTVAAGETLDFHVSATDPDWPSNTLTFTMSAFSMFDPPVNEATLDSHTGRFTWSATDMDEGNTLWFAVTVTDDGVPPLANTRIFQVEVSGHPPVLDISVLSGIPHLLWNSVPTRRYQIQYKAKLTDSTWLNLGGELSATGETQSVADDATLSHTNRFYRVLLVPVP